MGKVAAMVKVTAVDGKRDELVQAFGPLLDAVAQEGKTEVYALHLDATDPNTIWFYELYTDQDGQAEHSKSEAMKAAGPQLAPLMAGRPQVTPLTPVRAAKGLSFG